MLDLADFQVHEKITYKVFSEMMIGHASSAWRYRQFILSSIRGELKGRFASSKMGALWHILNPLAMAAIYALVLSKILGAKVGGVENDAAYAIYLMAGIASWGLFTEITLRCLNIFLEYSNTMKKIAFPRVALPLIVLGGALINHLLLLAASVMVFAFFSHFPSLPWIALPVGIILTAAFAFGLGIILGVLNVFVRDVGQFMLVVLQLWFWLTPIVYPFHVLPDAMQTIISYNPMLPVVQFYQDIMLYNKWPDFVSLQYPATLSIVLLLVAVFLFRRASPEIVDVL
ncbi:ABC transporter [Hyphomonas oceanitis SCH89]|uniref:Transport permease protein n=2 Tax=Hyphomonas oceanitis TaxID=81033 RepID=A0A059G269_9PROT|nr:ABC transporter [Hyphomonas oceanitis SCH89]